MNPILSRFTNVTEQSVNGQYRANCPECINRVGKEDTKQKLYINVDKVNYTLKAKGCWFCFRCGYAGWGLSASSAPPVVESYADKLSELFRMNNRPDMELTLPEFFTTNFNATRLGLEVKKYLYLREVPEALIVDRGIGYCYDGSLQGMVIIPFYDSRGKLTYYQGRSIRGKRFYNSFKGTKRQIYNLKEQDSVVICEGVFDALKLGEYGIATLGKTPSQDQIFKLIAAPFKNCLIAYDADATAVESAALAEKLMGIKEVSVLKLPPRYKDVGEIPNTLIPEVISRGAIKVNNLADLIMVRGLHGV